MWMTEIRRRAEIRIGELSRDLDRSSGGANPLSTLPTGGKSKEDTLLDAGISTSTAHRYEDLTGGADARGEAAAKRAIEDTLAKGRAERTQGIDISDEFLAQIRRFDRAAGSDGPPRGEDAPVTGLAPLFLSGRRRRRPWRLDDRHVCTAGRIEHGHAAARRRRLDDRHA